MVQDREKHLQVHSMLAETELQYNLSKGTIWMNYLVAMSPRCKILITAAIDIICHSRGKITCTQYPDIKYDNQDSSLVYNHMDKVLLHFVKCFFEQ